MHDYVNYTSRDGGRRTNVPNMKVKRTEKMLQHGQTSLDVLHVATLFVCDKQRPFLYYKKFIKRAIKKKSRLPCDL
jgi:hypothetical protein